MKSRHVINWLLLIFFTFNLPTFAIASEKPTSEKKVFILLRTKESPKKLLQFKSLVESDLKYNNVKALIETYKFNDPLPQTKIFKTAYNEGFDYILLIDQVYNYNVSISNNSVSVGSKYKLQSYNLKSSQPYWKKLGDANCNIEIKESVIQFSRQISDNLNSGTPITTNTVAFTTNNSNTNNEDNLVSLKEIELLNAQIELQKAKRERILSEIELLKLQTEKQIQIERQKTKNIALEIKKLSLQKEK